MRKIGTFQSANKVTFVYRDVENDEFIVRLYENGVKNEEATYFTDDKADALGTAKLMVGE